MPSLAYCCAPSGTALEAALAQWPHGSARPLSAVDATRPPSALVLACPQWRQDWSRLLQNWHSASLVICAEGGPAVIDEILQAGATTVITGAFDPERLECVIHTTLSRHKREQSLRRELEQARQALAERPIIEKAKGLLMQRHHLSEAQAYRTLREAAMQQQIRLAELARRLLENTR